jgi:hypothetical protein
MMYGRSCAKFSYFVPIIPLKWPPEALVGDWPIKKVFCKPFKSIEIWWESPLEILYKISSK